MSGAYKPSYTYEATNAHMRNCSGETMQKSTPHAYAIVAAKKRKKRKILRLVCILIAFFLAALIYFQTNVTRVLISVSEATMRSSAVEAINSAVYKTLGSNPSYEDLVKIERDESGNVAALSANALKINKIARDTASISQKILQETGENGVMIPIGALTGIEALAGAGKRINIDILPVCSVVCSFSSAFESVGINQTKHSDLFKRACGYQYRDGFAHRSFRRADGRACGRVRDRGKNPRNVFSDGSFGQNKRLVTYYKNWGFERQAQSLISVRFRVF